MGHLANKFNKLDMSSSEIKQATNIIVKQITSNSSPEYIYLFGSVAANTASELSDFDIAIIYKDQQTLKKARYKILTANLFKDLQVDLLFYTTRFFEEKSLIGGVCHEISNKGKIIYDKKSKI